MTGGDYDPSDWDYDVEAFKKEMCKYAIDDMRNRELDLVVIEVEKVEEVPRVGA